MAAKKRTKHQREKDLAEMSRLEAEGLTHRELAAKFGVSHQQIGYDLALLDRRFRAEQLANTERRKRRRHAELEQVKQKARAGFERSCRDAEAVSVETTEGRINKEGAALPDQVKTIKTATGQAGDPAFLEKELRAIEKQIDLWGDAAPKKIAPVTPDGEQEFGHGNLTPEQRQAELDAIFAAALERSGTAPGKKAVPGKQPG